MSFTDPYVEYQVGATPEDTFVVPYQFWEKNDLYVEVGGFQETNFNVTGAGDPTGGSIILVTPVTNTTVSIRRQTQVLRITDFPIAGPFRIEALNGEFDHVYGVLQDLDFGYDNITISWDNIIGKPSEYPPQPHTHLEADITDLDKYTQSEVDALQAAQDVTIADKLRWRGTWVQQTYEKNDMVVGDAVWLMVANKQTSDVAPPRPAGDPIWSITAPTWSTPSYSGVVESGVEWSNPTKPINITAFQIWVPTLSANTNYVIRTYEYPTDNPNDLTFSEIAEPLLVENVWTTIKAGARIMPPGRTFGILINALNSGSDTQVGPFDWSREADSNNVTPTSGSWNKSNDGSILRINKTDADGQNRTGDLTGVIAGSNVSIVQKDDATKSLIYRTASGETDGGDHFTWQVQLSDTGVGGPPDVGVASVITITVPLPSPTDYVTEVGGAPGAPVPQKGILRFDGVDQNADNDTFGARILVDEYIKSDDWDIAAYSGGAGGGGGGGGGATISTGPDFPDAADDGALHYLTVEPVGLYIKYTDATSSQWVQTNGGI